MPVTGSGVCAGPVRPEAGCRTVVSAPSGDGFVYIAVATIGGDRIFDGNISTLDYAFQPVKVQVPVGTTLVWQNNGAVIHTATANDNSFNTGDIPSGGSAAVTFNTAGTFNYNCSPHPWMIGQISVT